MEVRQAHRQGVTTAQAFWHGYSRLLAYAAAGVVVSLGIGTVLVFDWSYSIAWYGLVFLVVFALCALVVTGIWRVFSPRLHEASALIGTLLSIAGVLIGNPWWVPGYDRTAEVPQTDYLRGAFIVMAPIFFFTILVFCGWKIYELITARRARSGRSSGGRRQ